LAPRDGADVLTTVIGSLRSVHAVAVKLAMRSTVEWGSICIRDTLDAPIGFSESEVMTTPPRAPSHSTADGSNAPRAQLDEGVADIVSRM
jgi:hypothetical protein